MAVPTYEELLAHCSLDSSLMEQTFSEDHLMEFGSRLDKWETLALSLRLPSPEIENIKSSGDIEIQRYKLFKCWKQRCGSMATYKALVEALLRISRTDLAEKVIALRKSLRDTIQSPPSSPSETSLAIPTSPASNSGTEDMSPTAAMSPSSLPATPTEQTSQVIATLKELEEEFFDLVIYIEDMLKNRKVNLNTITRRFRMLPQSVQRQLQTDENYKEIRRRILDSETVKKLFDNLTELKHWNYMTPDTLAHILKDVKIDDVHKRVDEYIHKLLAFKTKTKLKELIGISFPVPDYCMELTMKVEGWEDKTIQEVENRTVNIVRRAVCSGSPLVSLGWKGVMPGSIKVTFILIDVESVKLMPEKFQFEDSSILNVQLDGDNIIHSKVYTKIPGKLWCSTGKMRHNAAGGREVLILAPDLSLPHPEAVTRRHGQLTEEDKLKLQNQGLPPDCLDELGIMKAKYDLGKAYTVVEVKSGQSLLRKEVLDNIDHLFITTQNDGVVLHYIGAGRRGTGDWCFEDGFITFRDIAQLYLRASHNFKGRVLTIISDCSYSGCWVRDCMEFLDEQGIQPCGHKAREKGILIKVVASCRSNEIPTEYCYTVSGTHNERNTGMIAFWISKQLLRTQTIDSIDSTSINCTSKTIDEPCTVLPGLTWKWLKEPRKTSSAAFDVSMIHLFKKLQLK